MHAWWRSRSFLVPSSPLPQTEEYSLSGHPASPHDLLHDFRFKRCPIDPSLSRIKLPLHGAFSPLMTVQHSCPATFRSVSASSHQSLQNRPLPMLEYFPLIKCTESWIIGNEYYCTRYRVRSRILILVPEPVCLPICGWERCRLIRIFPHSDQIGPVSVRATSIIKLGY